MPDLANGRWAGPVARLGRPRRAEMMARLRAGSGERVALVAFGGVHMRLPMESWDLGDGLRWLVPQSWGFVHPAVHAIESLGLDFSAPPVGLIARSKRYAMLVEDGVVTTLHLEESPGTCEISGGEALLAAI